MNKTEENLLEVEQLLNSIAGAETPVSPTHIKATSIMDSQGNVYHQVGRLTRQLHDTLRELGYDRTIERTVGNMPDARDRLNYISTLTEQAATKTLNAADAARPLQEELEANAKALAIRWEQVPAGQIDTEAFRVLVANTREHLLDVPLKTKATRALLMDIVMAQDFQDLTGQVIKKLADTVQLLEIQLMELLIAGASEEKRRGMDEMLLNGPVVNAEGRSDVVTSQEQVDDLLGSLGF